MTAVHEALNRIYGMWCSVCCGYDWKVEHEERRHPLRGAYTITLLCAVVQPMETRVRKLVDLESSIKDVSVEVLVLVHADLIDVSS